MKRLGFGAALFAAAFFACSMTGALAADMDMATKAPPYAVAPAVAAPTACGSVYDFFLTACPLSWYGVTFYGIVDMGGDYQTHGTPLDPNHPVTAHEFRRQHIACAIYFNIQRCRRQGKRSRDFWSRERLFVCF